MSDHFPPLDYERSPYTGWTRVHWEALLARMTYGYAQAADASGSPARVLYPDDRRGLPDAVDAIESFARIASAWGAWLHHPSNPAVLRFQGRELNVADLLRRALLEGTNPADERTYWGDIDHMDQRLVESADLAVAVWLSRERVFNTLAPAEQAQVMAWLGQVDGKGTYTDNWILFPAMAQAVRLHMGFPVDVADLDRKLDQLDEFYRGDGWYVDGPTNEFELYNAWMFHWHYLLWAWIDGDRRPELRRCVLGRARSFVEGFLHFFGANGSYPAWGRSIVYRFAAVAAFSTAHRLQCAPVEPGRLRRAASGCIRYFHERGLFDPVGHFVRQGYHGDFPAAGEAYISPGSPYWCCHGLFALALDAADPFWAAVEGPLPVEREDFELTLPAPGFLLAGRRATGQVLLLNSRSGQELDAPRHNYTSKYGKFAYSTHFPFNVVPVRGSYAPDGILALTRDGRSFGHRLHTREGGVAPGFMWCKFDELIDGELQPIWAAVLIWRDLQIRLAALRPTFPVCAFEAPGALGCERAGDVARRSDRAAGWEYAEVDGRAVAIRRLLGYDDQRVSAPFLGQSNTNLAYTYAEQPAVCEASPSVAARRLAAVSLVRPAPFDPAVELAGVAVRPEGAESFWLGLPDDEVVFVALGDALPKRVALNRVAIQGAGLRYARLAPGLDTVSGLGLTRVADVVELSAPGTLRLARVDGAAHVLTDVGLSLAEAWLRGSTRRVAVKALDGAWVDVTGRCGPRLIPPELVQEWAGENQRTLVEFRISR